MCDPKSHIRSINKGILWRNNKNLRVISPNSGIRAPPAITPGCISVLAFYLPNLHSALYQIRFRLPASCQSATTSLSCVPSIHALFCNSFNLRYERSFGSCILIDVALLITPSFYASFDRTLPKWLNYCLDLPNHKFV